MNKHWLSLALAGTLVASGAQAQNYPETIPFEMAGEVLDFSDTDALGLNIADGTETVTIFAPEEGGQQFAHGVVLMPFKDKLYAQWQSSARDEDGPDTIVVYAVSENGADWSEPMPMTEIWDEGYRSSGGGGPMGKRWFPFSTSGQTRCRRAVGMWNSSPAQTAKLGRSRSR